MFWPAIILVVPKNIVGIALGFATSLQNLGLVFFPLIIAFIFTKSQSYEVTLLFFIFNLIISLGLSIFIDIEDYKHNRILHSSMNEINIKNKSSDTKNQKTEKVQGETFGQLEKNEDEVRLLKIKELF